MSLSDAIGRVVRGGQGQYIFLSTSGRALTLLAIFGSAAIWSPTSFGEFSHAMAFALMWGTVATLGLGQGLLRILPLIEERNREYVFVVHLSIAAAILVGGASGFLAWFCLYLGIPAVPENLSGPFALIALSVWSVSFGLSLVVHGFFVGIQRSVFAGAIIAVRSVLFCLTLLVVSLAGLSIGTAVVVISLIELASGLLGLGVISRILAQRRELDSDAPKLSVSEKRALLRLALCNGTPGAIGDVSGQVALWVAVSLLYSVVGAAGVAVFSIGQRLFVIGTMISRQVALLFVPPLVLAKGHGDSVRFRQVARRSLKVVSGSGGVMFCASILCAIALPFINPDYQGDLAPLLLMATASLAASANAWLVSIQQSLGALKGWAAVEIASSISLILVAVVAVNEWGVLGVSAGFLASYTLRLLITAVLVMKVWRISIRAGF